MSEAAAKSPFMNSTFSCDIARPVSRAEGRAAKSAEPQTPGGLSRRGGSWSGRPRPLSLARRSREWKDRADLANRAQKKAGQPGLEPGVAGFGDRCLIQFGHWPSGQRL